MYIDICTYCSIVVILKVLVYTYEHILNLSLNYSTSNYVYYIVEVVNKVHNLKFSIISGSVAISINSTLQISL